MLEQFTCAYLTRNTVNPFREVYIGSQHATDFVKAWHSEYGENLPAFVYPSGAKPSNLNFEAHYPSIESGLTGLVHADIIASESSESRLDTAVSTVLEAGSPFTQIVLPIETDTRDLQLYLESNGFTIFGYRPSMGELHASLYYGKVSPGVSVVPTFWEDSKTDNPFWTNPELTHFGTIVENSW
jgi:hypothetical protein